MAFAELDELLNSMGQAGRRLSEIGASEGAAGNLSIYLRWRVEPASCFPLVEAITLPVAVPELAGATLLVTGSGQRLRDILEQPAAAIACITVDDDGRTGALYSAHERRFKRVTTEFNSHLAVYADQVRRMGASFAALAHAQPIHLTYLSHIPRYQEQSFLNDRLLRWQPETILNLPEGIGLVPFQLPGSDELMASTVERLRNQRVVMWVKHGVMARSDESILRAVDEVEYAETAARYEYLDLCAGGTGTRLSIEEVRAVCKAFNVQQSVF